VCAYVCVCVVCALCDLCALYRSPKLKDIGEYVANVWHEGPRYGRKGKISIYGHLWLIYGQFMATMV
jgi:hypothetical protein